MTASDSLRIVGITGSLRKNSFNTALLRAAAEAVPGIQFTVADLTEIPFYNEDIETPYPQAVLDLKEKIATAHAVVISTPEYNGMISGALKNALEWLSRPQLGQPCSGKPLGMMGAATTAFGTSAAQGQLRQLAFTLNMHLLNRPVVRVGNAPQKFDANGNLTDEPTKEVVKQFMAALIDWTKLLTANNG